MAFLRLLNYQLFLISLDAKQVYCSVFKQPSHFLKKHSQALNTLIIQELSCMHMCLMPVPSTSGASIECSKETKDPTTWGMCKRLRNKGNYQSHHVQNKPVHAIQCVQWNLLQRKWVYDCSFTGSHKSHRKEQINEKSAWEVQMCIFLNNGAAFLCNL